jgi:single-strand DNA-binding protein
MNYAHATIAGRVTRDPESRTTPSGALCCSFGVAVNNTFSKNAEKEASFFDVTFWGKTAELVQQYVRKGGLVLVDGRLEQQTWNDTSGAKRSKVVIVGNNFQLGPRASASGGSGGDSVRSDRGGQSGARGIYQRSGNGYAQTAQSVFGGSVHAEEAFMDGDDEIPF